MRDQVCFVISCIIVILLLFSVQASSAARISVQDMNVRPNGEASATLVLDSISPGISVYDITANITDPAKALITGVKYPSWAKFSRQHEAPSGDARLMVINDGSAPRDSLVLATITITGVAQGDTTLAVTVHELRDTKGQVVPVDISGGAISVSGQLVEGRPVSTVVQGTAYQAEGNIPATPVRHTPGFGVVLGLMGTLGAAAVVARRWSA
jgi:hypothetical protein